MNFKLKSNYKTIASALFLTAFSLNAFAQEEAPQPIEQVIETIQEDLASAKKLKISGYIQAQYQQADTAGIASMAGGDFKGNDNRFKVRRGRVKMAYGSGLSKAVLQIDITEKGVGINEAYLNIGKNCNLTAGVFDRPFGNEIAYSSTNLESLERSRITQTLFPGEKDLGGQLTLQAGKESAFHFLKLEAGLFNGNGLAEETDSYKDFIGHLSMSKTTTNQKLKWGLGASYYNGGFAATTENSYSIKNINGVKTFVKDSVGINSQTKREYIGFDGQLTIDWALGVTQIRAEYLMGTQPGTSSSSTSLKAANTKTVQQVNGANVTSSTVGIDTYNRTFNGYYVYFIQNILQSPFQAVVKYDVYDPNTDIAGNEIGTSGTKTGASDIKYSTLGFGLHYRFDSHTKISAYYDMVTNETTDKIATASTLSDLSKDRKDNVFTLRLQYKF